MTNVWLLAGRELKAYVRSPFGYIVAAAMLLIDGIWFQTMALGTSGAHLSADVLFQFFNGASGTTMIASVVLSMRLIAQERERHTLVLLNTAPIRDWEIVVGKYLALLAFLSVVNVATVYMPMLIFVHGRVAIGHIVVGYVGILLLGAASIAIGLFASALAGTQVVAIILGAVILATLVLLWMAAKVSDPPVSEFLAWLAIHNERQRPFMVGLLRAEHVVYYLMISYFFLLAAIKTLEARRWR